MPWCRFFLFTLVVRIHSAHQNYCLNYYAGAIGGVASYTAAYASIYFDFWWGVRLHERECFFFTVFFAYFYCVWKLLTVPSCLQFTLEAKTLFELVWNRCVCVFMRNMRAGVCMSKTKNSLFLCDLPVMRWVHKRCSATTLIVSFRWKKKRKYWNFKFPLF